MLWLHLASYIFADFPPLGSGVFFGNIPFLVVTVNQPRFLSEIPQMPRCPLCDCLFYGACFFVLREHPCKRCSFFPFHKSASCHDGVAFIMRLRFCGPGPRAAGEHRLSQWASVCSERWKGMRWVLPSPRLWNKAPLSTESGHLGTRCLTSLNPLQSLVSENSSVWNAEIENRA